MNTALSSCTFTTNRLDRRRYAKQAWHEYATSLHERSRSAYVLMRQPGNWIEAMKFSRTEGGGGTIHSKSKLLGRSGEIFHQKRLFNFNKRGALPPSHRVASSIGNSEETLQLWKHFHTCSIGSTRNKKSQASYPAWPREERNHTTLLLARFDASCAEQGTLAIAALLHGVGLTEITSNWARSNNRFSNTSNWNTC